MTVTEVQTTARDLYNATGDSFFSDTLLNSLMTEACNQLAEHGNLIERTYTTTTVANQQDYAYPTNTIAIKRLTLDGKKIKRVTHRQDDALTLSNQASTQTGFPVYYTDFDYTISFRTIPDTVYTLKIYSYNMAQSITNTSTLEIPSLWHFSIVDYLLYRMFTKDKDAAMMQFHRGEWEKTLIRARQYKAKMKRTDSFTTVQDEETLPVTIMGEA
jgi:hypothetical protein